jgi:hypothetical protein
LAWKLALAIALAGAIIIGASARAPRRSIPRGDLQRLLLSAAALYAVALLALLKHRGPLTILLFAAGVATSALALWLSRGHEDGGPPPGEEPIERHPPPGPDGLGATFDWVRFERELRAYTDRTRDAVTSS